MPARLARNVERVQAAMAEQGLDGLVVAGRGMISHYGHLEFVAGYTPIVRLAYAVVTPGGTPVLIVPTAADRWQAAQLTGLPDVRVAGQGDVVADFDDLPSAVAGVLAERGADRGRVGISGLEHVIPAAHGDALRAALRDADLVQATGLITALKTIKADDELAELRATAAIAQEGLRACRERIAAGVTDREVAAAMQDAVRSRGARDVLIFVSAAPYFLDHPRGTSLRDGDLVTAYVEISGPTGYWLESAALFAIGDLDEPRRRLADACLAAAAQAEAQLRAGRRASDVAAPIDRIAGELGCESGIWHGHGVGLDHDEPVITAGDRTELQPGMTISVHPNFSTGAGGASVANTYAVTGGEPECLTAFVPREVVAVPGGAGS